MRKTGFASLISLCSVMLGASFAAFFLKDRVTQEPLPSLATVPSFEMIDSTGQSFGSQQLVGKAWVLSFFFSRCQSVCPALNSKIRSLYNATSADGLQFVSVSVDPKNDTPEVLSKYAKRYRGEDRRWQFLSATKEQVQSLAAAVQLARGNAEEDLSTHSTRLVLIDKEMQVRGFYQSEPGSEGLDALLRDYKRIK